MLDFKQCDIVEPPCLNAQISDSSDSEDNLQSTQNLLKVEHKVYIFMPNMNKMRK